MTARAGLNRFVWDLRYPATREAKDVINDEGATLGPVVAPGRYSVRLIGKGSNADQRVRRARRPASDRRRKPSTTRNWRWRSRSRRRRTRSPTPPSASSISSTLSTTASRRRRANRTRSASATRPSRSTRRSRRFAIRWWRFIPTPTRSRSTTRFVITTCCCRSPAWSRAPTPARRSRRARSSQDLRPKIDAHLTRLRSVEATDIGSFNALLKELNVPAIPGPPPVIVP